MASPENPKSILIFGLGAVGAVYGLLLSQAGCAVTAVCRSNYDHVREHGVQIRSPFFGHQTYHPRAVKTVSEAATSPNGQPVVYAYVLVASKALPGTAELIKDAVAPGRTAIVLAQNGIGLEAEYAALYPSNTLISGVVYLPVTQVAPGEIEHAGHLQRFEIGTYPPSSSHPNAKYAEAQTHTLSSLFTTGGASAPVFPDIQPTKWRKLAINAAWNPITALTLCDDANYLRAGPPSSAVSSESSIVDIMTEVGVVAAAAGYPDAITPAWIAEDLGRPLARVQTGGKEPSMLVDVKMGRRMEVEAILGNVVRSAEELGVERGAVKGLRLLYALARGRDFEIRRPEGQGGWGEIARH